MYVCICTCIRIYIYIYIHLHKHTIICVLHQAEGYSVPAGTLKVSTAQAIKWIRPEHCPHVDTGVCEKALLRIIILLGR